MESVPLVAVGGARIPGVTVTAMMHSGYDTCMNLHGKLMTAVGWKPGLYMVNGSYENPLLSWPVWVLVEGNPDEEVAER